MFLYPFSKKHNLQKTFKLHYSSDNNKYTNEIFNKHLHNTTEVGHIKHYPPTVRVWNNSVYNFNKRTQDDSFTKYDRLNKIIKNYFNLHNDIKLARSKRMRYLRVKSISRRLYISRPEVKQTNDKIIITVYYFDKLKHSFTRKSFFYNRPNIVRFLLNKKLRKRKLISNVKLLDKRIKYLGIKQIKELKLFKDRNKFKNKYLEQSLWLYFFKYLLSLVNIQIYNPIYLSSNLMYSNNIHQYLKLIMKKERSKINKIIESNPKMLFWINFNNYSFEKIEYGNINYIYLITKTINEYNFLFKNISNFKKSNLINLNFISEINKKLLTIINNYFIKNILSNSIVSKFYNYLSLKVYKNLTRKLFNKQYNKISKLTHLSMSNVIKFKNILPALKMLIDTFYNKKTELNMVNLKYFFLHSDIFTQALILKLKKKISPTVIINKSLNKIKVFLNHNVRKQTILNNMDKLYAYPNLSLNYFPVNAIQSNIQSEFANSEDWIQTIFNKLFPNNLLQKYNRSESKFNNKITNILNIVKYKGILGIRIEAKGRLTRRHKAARAISHISYKGNLKDNEWYYNEEENFERSKSTVLLRNDNRANLQYTSKSSIRRIGSFGIKTWISSK